MLLDKCRPEAEEIEEICEKFQMSVGSNNLSYYLSLVMISCYERIQNGNFLFDSLYLLKNKQHHLNFDSFMARKREVDHTQAAESEMLVDFNLRNMLGMHRSLRNIEDQNVQILRRIVDVRQHLVGVVHSMNRIHSILTLRQRF